MQIIKAQPVKENFNIAIVISRFNEEITNALYEGALTRLHELNFTQEHITIVWVPGAVEIPIAAQQLAHTDHYEAIICLGAVVRGETDHYEYVCQQVSYGCQRVALKNKLPIIFGILTTETDEQALTRATGEENKGRYCVDAALEMVSILRQIRG